MEHIETVMQAARALRQSQQPASSGTVDGMRARTSSTDQPAQGFQFVSMVSSGDGLGGGYPTAQRRHGNIAHAVGPGSPQTAPSDDCKCM